MRRIMIDRKVGAGARKRADRLEVLPLDPRDPAIVRAKQLRRDASLARDVDASSTRT